MGEVDPYPGAGRYVFSLGTSEKGSNQSRFLTKKSDGRWPDCQ